jgi:hypothetical protein
MVITKEKGGYRVAIPALSFAFYPDIAAAMVRVSNLLPLAQKEG